MQRNMRATILLAGITGLLASCVSGRSTGGLRSLEGITAGYQMLPRTTFDCVATSADSNFYVYFLSTTTPERARQAGGFERPDDGTEKAYSLAHALDVDSAYHVVYGTSQPGLDLTQVAATLPSAESAPAPKYLYQVKATPNMIDLALSLGEPTAATSYSFAAARKVVWSQVTRWFTPDQVSSGMQSKFFSVWPQADSSITNVNPDYNYDFDEYQASGAQPQLAGFPASSSVWSKAPWSAFRPSLGKSTRDYAMEFSRENGVAVGWTVEPPLDVQSDRTPEKPKETHSNNIPKKGKDIPSDKPSDKGSDKMALQIITGIGSGFAAFGLSGLIVLTMSEGAAPVSGAVAISIALGEAEAAMTDEIIPILMEQLEVYNGPLESLPEALLEPALLVRAVPSQAMGGNTNEGKRSSIYTSEVNHRQQKANALRPLMLSAVRQGVVRGLGAAKQKMGV